ncbi:universal stress protein [Sinomicrobium soli]|uniref:universal stress protein n=1 Tax=Sinomicrobium sp. N-1-3-6 TaxID=2219864 RepID=UPI001374EF04|nr:universal stress protein [Sinomicrobium sp. N-1-3-6]
MKKILLPTDFSDNSWNAIVYALKMFADEECEFYMLHTQVPGFYEADYQGVIDKTSSELQATLDRVQQEHHNKKHKFYLHSAIAALTDEIGNIVRDREIEMIIMGTRGATGAKRILFGSNTVRVMRKAAVPVLAIPDRYAYTKTERILFPTDYLGSFGKDELQPLVNMAKKFGAGITVLHVEEDPELMENERENKEKLSGLLSGTDMEFTVVRDTDIPAAIQDYLHRHHYDMLAMMHRKHSFLGRLLLKQKIEDIGFNLEIPFLVLQGTPPE